MTDLITELRWRGLVQDATPGLEAHLRQPRRVYCGFDPTAPSLQVGNLMPLTLLRHFQQRGHTPIVLMGGGTGLIGDPSGKRSERPLLSRDEVRAHLERQQTQMARFLDFGPGPSGALLRDNAVWLESVPLVTFLRDVGKHFTVNVMMQKESVKARLDTGLSYTEFSYMLLQAYDFLQLFRTDGCTIQVGGSDQWGNITAGADLIRRVDGAEAHGLVAPLLTTASGAKFGKSESGAIYLDPAATSPYRFYQYWINADDRDVEGYLRLFTGLTRDAIAALLEEHARTAGERPAHHALARELTTLVHGGDAAASAADTARLLFGAFDPRLASAAVFETLAAEVPTAPAPDGVLTLVDAVVLAGLARSKAEARRGIEQGGVYVNQARESDAARVVGEADWLAGRNLLLRKGKKDYALLRRG